MWGGGGVTICSLHSISFTVLLWFVLNVTGEVERKEGFNEHILSKCRKDIMANKSPFNSWML